MTVLLGCIADDFTGATDLAGMLVKAGMRTVQLIGVPKGPAPEGADAIVIALKSRTVPAKEAIADSLAALAWLQQSGCQQFYFKYCSTFDSTPEGNIGPVAEALADAVDVKGVVACPAFPAMGRTVYQGHLFVGGQLLSESGMQHHPLTPMTDSDIRRWLRLQTGSEGGHVPAQVVGEGAEAINAALRARAQRGETLAIVDAVADEDLVRIG